MYRSIWKIILFIVLIPYRARAMSRENPYLANSVWPIAQHDVYSQASTNLPGPLQPQTVDTLFGIEVAGPLTMLYTPDNNVIWGSSFGHVFKVDRSKNYLRLIDSIKKDTQQVNEDVFRGIYSVLTKEGIFYMQTGSVINAYTDAIPGDYYSPIRHVGSFNTKLYNKYENERVLALSITFDGQLIWVSSRGGIGILSRNLETVLDFKYLPIKNIHVSNSVAVDESGGIYVVSSCCIHRVWWNSSDQKLHLNDQTRVCPFSNLNQDYYVNCNSWTTPYPSEKFDQERRPTKEGSGTTPSLLKDQKSGKFFVIIADGMMRQSVLAIDCLTGDIVASAPVDFGNGVPDTESYTEQSILIAGNKLIVTQNAFTQVANRLANMMNTTRITDFISRIDLPQGLKENVHLLPVLMGDSPFGYQQFELVNLQNGNFKLYSTWTRNDTGCPNAIPTMSLDTGVLYCVGKSMLFGNYPNSGFRGSWTIEGLDWETGETVMKVRTGNTIMYNSLYAATQIGPNREIIYGSIGGIVRVQSVSAEKSFFYNPQQSTSNFNNKNSKFNTIFNEDGKSITERFTNEVSRSFLNDILKTVKNVEGLTGVTRNGSDNHSLDIRSGERKHLTGLPKLVSENSKNIVETLKNRRSL